jgi:acetoin utilization deacetylase AcuC-like enzyme
MLPFKLIYHERYDLHLYAHVFPSQKYRLVGKLLLHEGIAGALDFATPEQATDEDILRAHTPGYLGKLKRNELSDRERMRLEIPFNAETFEAFRLAAGGSILAGECALAARTAAANGWAANLGGGFHHACPDHGEGFCVLNDVAIAIRHLQACGKIRTAMVVDTDVHQGNGTAEIFHGDVSVFTLSLHQEDIYPEPKSHSDRDVNLAAGTDDAEYLAVLETNLSAALYDFEADMIFYVAGADPYGEDQLGGLALTTTGLAARDALVFRHARSRNIPVAVTLAGGYARCVEDTVRIHTNTILAMKDAAMPNTAMHNAVLKDGAAPHRMDPRIELARRPIN